jgi:hypothetical protein
MDRVVVGVGVAFNAPSSRQGDVPQHRFTGWQDIVRFTGEGLPKGKVGVCAKHGLKSCQDCIMSEHRQSDKPIALSRIAHVCPAIAVGIVYVHDPPTIGQKRVCGKFGAAIPKRLLKGCHAVGSNIFTQGIAPI